MVKTLCFYCRGHRFDPWLGKIPCPGVLGLCAATTEAHVPRAHALQQQKSVTAMRSLRTTRESPCTAKKTQHSQKLNS